jgi:hypothetical protein
MRTTFSEVLENLEADQGVEIPMDPDYWEKLHCRIMGAVDNWSQANTPPWFDRPQSLWPAPSWRTNLLPSVAPEK